MGFEILPQISTNIFAAIGVEWVESVRFLGMKIIDFGDFSELLVRFILNTGMLLLIVKSYLSYSTRRNFAFSFLAV